MTVNDLPYPLRLCVELLWYAGMSCPKTQDMKASQIKEAVSVFFEDAMIAEATDILCGRMVLRVGSRIKFAEDEQPYTIRAASSRWGICTRPFVEQDREDFEYDGDDAPPVYTIIDWDRMVRGRHNLIFNPYKFETDEGCRECLAALEAGECELSQRTGGSVPLVLSE